MLVSSLPDPSPENKAGGFKEWNMASEVHNIEIGL